MAVPLSVQELLFQRMVSMREVVPHRYQKEAACQVAAKLGLPLLPLEKEAYRIARRRGSFVFFVFPPLSFFFPLQALARWSPRSFFSHGSPESSRVAKRKKNKTKQVVLPSFEMEMEAAATPVLLLLGMPLPSDNGVEPPPA